MVLRDTELVLYDRVTTRCWFFFFFVYINFHVAPAHFLSVFHCFFADKFYFPFKYTVGKNFGIYQLMKDFIGKDLKLWLEKLKGKYFSLEFFMEFLRWYIIDQFKICFGNLNKNTDKTANTGSFDCIRFLFYRIDTENIDSKVRYLKIKKKKQNLYLATVFQFFLTDGFIKPKNRIPEFLLQVLYC